MNDDIREFELGAVISAATGWDVARDGLPATANIFEYLTNGTAVYAHQLPRLHRECQPGLLEQFPWMRDLIPLDFDMSNWESWLDEQVAIHGATLQVKSLDPSQYTVPHPVSEFIEMASRAPK